VSAWLWALLLLVVIAANGLAAVAPALLDLGRDRKERAVRAEATLERWRELEARNAELDAAARVEAERRVAAILADLKGGRP